jgi:hypothetical protein
MPQLIYVVFLLESLLCGVIPAPYCQHQVDAKIHQRSELATTHPGLKQPVRSSEG